MEINETKLHEFLGKMVTEMGAAANGALIILGDKLGLYKSLATNGPMTSEELADTTQTTERYVREWLAAQAASTYIEYDVKNNKFWMTPEQAAVFADEERITPVPPIPPIPPMSTVSHTASSAPALVAASSLMHSLHQPVKRSCGL